MLDFFQWPLVAISAVIIAVLAFEVAMFVHMLRNKALSETAKVIWAIAMVLVHPLASVVYFVVFPVRPAMHKNEKTNLA